jgi:two-component system, NtrC family, response regulator AtoC
MGDTAMQMQGIPARALGPAGAEARVHTLRLRQRLEDEIARALASGRPLGVAVLRLGRAQAREGLEARAATVLRQGDVLGRDSVAQLLAILPDRDGEAACAVARDAVAALVPLAAEARAGVATCPGDGCDAETLLSGARAAAALAAPGQARLAADTTVRYTIGGHTVVAAEPAMMRVFDLLRRLAACDLAVLVLGETGTGKEHAAAALHHWSPRSDRPLVTLNCAAIPETLIESELFGYEKGAFSDARAVKPGLLEQATGGTVFLDEVAELGPGAQAKLLRALDSKRITRLGGLRERTLDIRVVAATHRDLEAECRAGRFRQDLMFRLGAAMVELPPLRRRPREISLLARLFVAEACARAGRPTLEISEATLRRLAAHPWPGNVRELEHTMELVVATAESDIIEPWSLPDRVAGHAVTQRIAVADASEAASDMVASPAPAPRQFRPIAEEMRELERTRMREALEAAGGVQARAAELIHMPIRTFALRLKQYGICARDVKRRRA